MLVMAFHLFIHLFIIVIYYCYYYFFVVCFPVLAMERTFWFLCSLEAISVNPLVMTDGQFLVKTYFLLSNIKAFRSE